MIMVDRVTQLVVDKTKITNMKKIIIFTFIVFLFLINKSFGQSELLNIVKSIESNVRAADIGNVSWESNTRIGILLNDSIVFKKDLINIKLTDVKSIKLDFCDEKRVFFGLNGTRGIIVIYLKEDD